MSFPSGKNLNLWKRVSGTLISAAYAFLSTASIGAAAENVDDQAHRNWARLSMDAARCVRHHEFARAEQLYLQALSAAQDKNLLVESDRDLADFYYRKGDLVSAKKYYEDCLAAATELYGEDNQQLDPVIDRLLSIAQKTNDAEHTARYLGRLYLLRTRIFPPADPKVKSLKIRAASVLALFADHRKSSEYAQLQRLMLQAADSPEREARLESIYQFEAEILNSEQNYALAKPLLELQIATDQNPRRRTYALHYLGYAEARAGKFKRANELLSECVNIRRKNKQYRSLILSLEVFGEVYRLQNRPDLALPLYMEAKDRWQDVPGADKDPGRYIDSLYVGMCLSQSHKTAESFPWLKLAVENLEKQHQQKSGKENPYLVLACEQLRAVCHELHKDKEAESIIKTGHDGSTN